MFSCMSVSLVSINTLSFISWVKKKNISSIYYVFSLFYVFETNLNENRWKTQSKTMIAKYEKIYSKHFLFSLP